MKFIMIGIFLLMSGCASKVLVKDCNKVYDRNGNFTGESVCIKPGWF